MIWGTSASYTGSAQWGFGAQKAMQSPKLECIVHQTMWMEDALTFSDIILPITSAAGTCPTSTSGDRYL